ncbi:hypothetical protein ABI_47650 [Asticcacaulis biprosthecium C19]|uniref:Uncharacterized protein n=1 Tax=Asticcacaulis biprosthecium C19 TaxID=715226 RepID=F4QUB6_9CAUL|nr:hypothetical protein ABI_47650 [Asticcacaulis biprosthecium C19]
MRPLDKLSAHLGNCHESKLGENPYICLKVSNCSYFCSGG